MRFKAAVLGTALLMLGAGAASAGSNYVGLTGGAGIPTGDYSNAASTGWQIGATGTHYVNDMWGFGGDLCYHGWGGSKDMNDALEATLGPDSKISFTALQVTAHAIMNFQNSGNVRPYAKVGTGLYNIGSKLESPSGNADGSDSKFGFNIGAGMNFLNSSNMRWGIEGSYHIIPVDTGSSFGSDLNFMQVGVNVAWGMGN
jgi:opacity protein-like surface antigen